MSKKRKNKISDDKINNEEQENKYGDKEERF